MNTPNVRNGGRKNDEWRENEKTRVEFCCEWLLILHQFCCSFKQFVYAPFADNNPNSEFILWQLSIFIAEKTTSAKRRLFQKLIKHV